MIDIEKLTDKDVGRWVVYVDMVREPEIGRIKSWNDKYVFVVYKCNGDWKNFQKYTGVATDPRDLFFVEDFVSLFGKYEQWVKEVVEE